MSTPDNVQTAKDLCTAFSTYCNCPTFTNLTHTLSFFSHDAQIRVMGSLNPPTTGVYEIEKLALWMASVMDRSYEVFYVNVGKSEDGKTIFVERLDRFPVRKRKVDMPVMGVMTFNAEGKCVLWKEYFDMKPIEGFFEPPERSDEDIDAKDLEKNLEDQLT